MSGDNDQSAYLRGKLRLAGVTADTPLDEALDAVMVLEVDGIPGEQIGKWRKLTDRATWKIRPPDRESWGQKPDQQAAMGKLAGSGFVAPQVNP